MANTFFLYGATRSGKTRLMVTLRHAGRLLIADVDGQAEHEAPDSFQLEFPPAAAAGATAEQQAERLALRNARIVESLDHAVVRWPVYTTRDLHAMLAAVSSGKLGKFASIGADSLTYLFDRLIAEICGVTVIHKKGGDEEEATDPVFTALADFTGAGVKRSMEKKDWQRFAQKSSEIVSGLLATARRLGANVACTALEVRRELYDGDKFLGIQQGPLLRGRVSANDIPPLFNFFFRCEARMPKDAEGNVANDAKPVFAVWTVPHRGWPAGVRGAAFGKLDAHEEPDLMAILEKANAR